MPEWHPYQVDFSGGVVSPRVINRLDTDIYRRSLLQMYNWMPTLQGPAQRSPGSFFVEELTGESTARVIPYLNIDDRRSIVILTDQDLRVLVGLPDEGGTPIISNVVSGFRKNIVVNSEFTASQGGWGLDPELYYSKDGGVIGSWYSGNQLWNVCRLWKYPAIDSTTCLVRQTVNVDFPTSVGTLDLRAIYAANPGTTPQKENADPNELYDAFIRIGTTLGSSDVLNLELRGPVGTITERVLNFDMPSPSYTGDLFVEFFLEATFYASTPDFRLDRLNIFIDTERPSDDVNVASPFTADEIPDIQWVQSPYANKELVLVHPNHIPHWLFFDGSGYVLQPIPFVNPPDFWATGNYPSACSAYQGRLLLGGTPRQSETIVGSRPGIWEDFTVQPVTPGEPVTADNAIEFTSIFRGPTQWIAGQKDLIIGANTFECVVQSDTGILKPDDIDVRLHSTHGSIAVQPVGMGQYVAFAGENGSRVRAAQLNDDNVGWISPDKTLLADHLTASRVRRMTRMRNPHQMLMCVTGDGNIAVLHEDPYAGVSGWSQMNFGGEVIDAVSNPTDSGLDVLYLVIARYVNGQRRVSLEAVLDWSDANTWRFLNGYRLYNFTTPSSVLDGLEHLEGRRVDVVGDNNFLGTYIVSGGEIQLETEVILAHAGIPMRNYIQTLPQQSTIETGGLGSQKRYVEFAVRVFGTRPTLNENFLFDTPGEVIPERSPIHVMDQSAPREIFPLDAKVVNLGWNPFETLTVEEKSPFQCQLIAIHGKLASKSL